MSFLSGVVFSLAVIGFFVFLFTLTVIFRVLNPDYQTYVFVEICGMTLVLLIDGEISEVRNTSGFRFHVESEVLKADISWDYVPVPYEDDNWLQRIVNPEQYASENQPP